MSKTLLDTNPTRRRRREDEDYRSHLARFLWLSGVTLDDLDAVRRDIAGWTAANSSVAAELEAVLDPRPAYWGKLDCEARVAWYMRKAEKENLPLYSASNLRELLKIGSKRLVEARACLLSEGLIALAPRPDGGLAPYTLTDAGRAEVDRWGEG